MELKEINVLRKLLHYVRFKDENINFEEVMFSPILSQIINTVEMRYDEEMEAKFSGTTKSFGKELPSKFHEQIVKNLSNKKNWNSLSLALKKEYIVIICAPYHVDDDRIKLLLSEVDKVA